MGGADEVLHNHVVSAGFQVVLGRATLEDMARLVETDPAIVAASDEQLDGLLAQATAFHQANCDCEESAAIYASLVFGCARNRLNAVSSLRAAAEASGGLDLDERRSDWISRTARAALVLAMSQIQKPDLKDAFRTFAQASLIAQDLPDFDPRRLEKVIWATFGMLQVATAAGQVRQEAQARTLLDSVTPGWNTAPTSALSALGAEFQRRLARRASTSGGSRSDSRVEAEALRYSKALAEYAAHVDAGELSEAEAVVRLLGSTEVMSLPHGLLRLVAELPLSDRRPGPQTAVTTARLHRSVVISPAISSERSTLAFADRVLGILLVLARPTQTGPYFEAATHLEAAISVFDHDGDSQRADDCALMLGQAYRGARDFDRAIAWDQEAIARFEALPPSPERSVSLGNSWGNLADAQEQAGDRLKALGNHHRAYLLLLEGGNLTNARKALFNIIRVSEQTGFSDEALRAAGAAKALLRNSADVAGMIDVYLRSARSSFRTQRFAEGVSALGRAEALLESALTVKEPGIDVLQQLFGLRLWQGCALFLAGDVERQQFLEAMKYLESARQIAIHLSDDDRLAQSTILMAHAHIRDADYDAAIRCCDSVEFVACSPIFRAQANEARGYGLLRAGRCEAAIVDLRSAADAFASLRSRDKEIAATGGLAEAKEGLGDLDGAREGYEKALTMFEEVCAALGEEGRIGFRGTVQEYYVRLIRLYALPGGELHDSALGLQWVERSKARSFLVMMGLSPFALAGIPNQAEALLSKEVGLIAAVRVARALGDVVVSSPADLIRAPTMEYQAMENLRTLWRELASICPKYVALRTGDVTDWRTLQELLVDD